MHVRGLLQVCLTRSHMDVHAGIFVCPTSAQDSDSLITAARRFRSIILANFSSGNPRQNHRGGYEVASRRRMHREEGCKGTLSISTIMQDKQNQVISDKHKKEAKSKRQKSQVIMSVTIPSQMQENLEKKRYAKTPTGNDGQIIDKIGDIHRLDSATLLSTQES